MIAALAVIAALANGATADALDLFPPKVSAVASPSEVRLGQEITLVITATYHTGVVVNLPDPLFPAGAPLEIAHRDSADSKMSDGATLQRVWQLRVYPWELGEFDIPPIQVTFEAGGKVATVATNAIPLRVIEVVGGVDDPKQMRSMAPPVPLSRRSWLLVWVAAGVAIAFVIAFNLITWRRRKKKKARAIAVPIHLGEPTAVASSEQKSEGATREGDPYRDVPAPIVAPPPAKPVMIVRARRKLDRIAEEALARLRALELSGRLDSDRRGAYRDMVAIIRDYLAARYDVDAPELTTRELCQALTFRSADAAGLTRAWLADCDVVKYAGTSATGEQIRGSLDGAVWLIDRTSPGAMHEAAGA